MKRPYVIISSAVSADGKLACANRRRLALSNEEDRREVDKLRSEVDAVLVGSTTLENDNPSLTLKFDENRGARRRRGLPEEPMKVAISKNCDISPKSRFLSLGVGRRVIFTTSEAGEKDVRRTRKYAEVFQSKTSKVGIKWLLGTLYGLGVRRLMVEGGGGTNAAFMNESVVDEMRIAVAPLIVGGAGAPTLIDGPDSCRPKRFHLAGVKRLKEMVVLRYLR